MLVSLALPVAALLCASPAHPPAVDSALTRQLKAEAAAYAPLVRTPWVKQWLAEARSLRSIGTRVFFHDAEKTRYLTLAEAAKLGDAERAALTRREVDDEVYWSRYSTPIAYARPFEILGQVGFRPKRAKVLDFGYGNIGQLYLLSRVGAQVTGIEVDPLLPKLYSEQRAVRILHGYFPTDARLVEEVGGGYDLFLSKNTLKRGYVHPAVEVAKKQRIDLGVSDRAFVAQLYSMLKPGGRVLIYNICPAPAPAGKPYIPWADGRSPFSRETWEEAGFEVIAFDQDDSPAIRTLARTLGWDKDPQSPMDVENDLFATYTLLARPK